MERLTELPPIKPVEIDLEKLGRIVHERSSISREAWLRQNNPFSQKFSIPMFITVNGVAVVLSTLAFVALNVGKPLLITIESVETFLDFLAKPVAFVGATSSAIMGFINYNFSRRNLEIQWRAKEEDENKPKIEEQMRLIESLIDAFQTVTMKIAECEMQEISLPNIATLDRSSLVRSLQHIRTRLMRRKNEIRQIVDQSCARLTSLGVRTEDLVAYFSFFEIDENSQDSGAT